MADIIYQPVTLNDGIHRILNRKYDWCSSVNANSFNEYNCPLLHNRDRNEVPTYKDWVSILGGNPNVNQTGTAQGQNSCLRANQTGGTNKPWGRTLGTPAGPNGKPLCETKPLDEAFWYYNDQFAPFDYAFDPFPWTISEAVIWFSYHDGLWAKKWKFSYDQRQGYVAQGERIFDTILGAPILQPGIYGAMVNENVAQGYMIQLENGEVFMDAGWHGVSNWKNYNTIFFVDSPIRLIPVWGNGGGVNVNGTVCYHLMQTTCFRFTPPGYWKP